MVLIDDTTVMSSAEVKRVADMVKNEAARGAGDEMVEKLRQWVSAADASDDVKALVDSL